MMRKEATYKEPFDLTLTMEVKSTEEWESRE